MRPPLPARRLRALALALSLPALAGCFDVLGLGSDKRERALAEARARWRAQGPARYEFEFSRICFCLLGGQPMTVTVRDGAVVAVVPVEPLPEGYPAPRVQDHYTVEQLFARIADAIERDAHRLSATYHPSLGYPTSVFIDYEENVADEEFGWSATNLRPTS